MDSVARPFQVDFPCNPACSPSATCMLTKALTNAQPGAQVCTTLQPIGGFLFRPPTLQRRVLSHTVNCRPMQGSLWTTNLSFLNFSTSLKKPTTPPPPPHTDARTHACTQAGMQAGTHMRASVRAKERNCAWLRTAIHALSEQVCTTTRSFHVCQQAEPCQDSLGVYKTNRKRKQTGRNLRAKSLFDCVAVAGRIRTSNVVVTL